MKNAKFKLGLRRVLKTRTDSKGSIRKFKVRKVNFIAKDYIGMISWPENDITESPLLKHVSRGSIKDFIREGIIS